MASLSLGFQLLLIVFLLAYAAFLFRSGLNPKVLRRCALIILLSGTVLLTYGFTMESYNEGIITSLLRSLFLSAKMFVYDSELIELENAQHTPFFLEIYFFILYSAVITSLSAILMIFSKRALTHFILLFRKKKFDHVFLGTGDRCRMVSDGIKGGEVAFIEFPLEDGHANTSIAGLLGNRGGKSSSEDFLYDRKHPVLRATHNLHQGNGCENVFATIGLRRLKSLIDSNTSFYILSEDLERNMDNLISLLADKDMVNCPIHVCISREGASRYYKTVLKGTGVHFIYPSSMSVVELMQNSSCQPAIVTSQTRGSGLNALVIGFGETGQAVAKYLYEYSSEILEDGSAAPARITVVDRKASMLKGPFIFDNPGICDDGIISFKNIGTYSEDLWQLLMSEIDKLNFISISVGDVQTNMDLACTIFSYAKKVRRGCLEGLRIVVRKEHSLPHENELIARLNASVGCEVIICYGEFEKIFTPEMIVSEDGSGINRKATARADKLSAAYSEISGKTPGTSRMELHQFISRANFAPSMKALSGGQDPADEHVMERLARTEHLRYCRYLLAHGYTFGTVDDEVRRTNHQICPWEKLTREERQYHKDMVLAQLSSHFA